MTVGSQGFVVLVAVTSIAFPLIPGVRTRQAALAACSLAFLASFIGNAATWIALAAFLSSGYVAAKVLRARPRTVLFAAYLAALVTAFVWIKKYDFLADLLPAALLTHPVAIVGISYMLFRQVHFVVDSMQQQVSRQSLWDYINYQLNLFALLAGPIQRYNEFCESWSRLEPLPQDWREVAAVWIRILSGVVKMWGFGAVLLFAYEKCHTRLIGLAGGAPNDGAWVVLTLFAGLFITYPLYMYANFSGYCDVAIGSASLFGLALPENFDRPYLSRNLIDFWTRWHRTLGFWIRDYLFIPLYRFVAETWPRSAAKLAFLCYFVAFVIAGVWHGTSSSYLVFGLLHGIGTSAAKIWETLVIRRRGRAGLRTYLASRPIRALAIAGTMGYFALTMFFFADSIEGCFLILRVVRAAISGLGGM